MLPIGVLYDPFVGRALDPWSFGIYAGGQSILVGTPSGVTLAPEGDAHQSITTPSIGLEQPGCISYEPAFALDTEWCLLAAMGRLGRQDGSSAYLRLSTRPIDRTERLAALAISAAAAVVVTSPGLLFRALQARRGMDEAPTWILDSAFPAGRAAPTVTVLDGHPHTLAFLAGVYEYHGLDTDTIVGAALDLVDQGLTRRRLAPPRGCPGPVHGTGAPLGLRRLGGRGRAPACTSDPPP